MCSWCWGFAPEIESLAEELPVEIVVGGLRPGPMAQPLSGGLANFLKSEWPKIGKQTGQPFDPSSLDEREGWIYDTEPAAIAITQLRNQNEGQTLDYFTDIQQAFYAEGKDVTDFDVLTDLATPHGAEDGFRELLGTEEAKKEAWADFSRARNWGISGFPTLVGVLPEDRLALLARGWAPSDLIRERINSVAELGVS